MNEMNDDIPEDDIVFPNSYLLVFFIVVIACGFSVGLKLGKNETIKELCQKNNYDFCETICGIR